MKEKPILFCADMVRAIIDGRKSVTRRVIKPQPAYPIKSCTNGFYINNPNASSSGNPVFCSPYTVGTRLWVKETWRVGAWNVEGEICVDYKADNFARREWLTVDDPEQFERLCIQSTDQAHESGLRPDDFGTYRWKAGEAPTKWRPSIFMPRWVARLFLEVISVRAERVQGITNDDAILEGIPVEDDNPRGWNLAQQHYAALWEKLNSKRGYGWEANPWVWRIEFEKVEVKP